MRRIGIVRALLASVLMVGVSVIALEAPAFADSGIASAKGCSPTTVAIGSEVACHYVFSNTNSLGSDGAGNTVTLASIVDTIMSSPTTFRETCSRRSLPPMERDLL